jgi:hypothetical protein
MSRGAEAQNLSLGVLAHLRKANERRPPIHPAHFHRIDHRVCQQMYLEHGYGERYGVADGELAELVGGISVAAGRGHEPRPIPGPLTERSDLMTQKICFDCFHKLFPDKPIRKVTLGRQCAVCKAQTDRTEQMIPVEAEDIPLVKQIAQVPRRVLHRTERHGRGTTSRPRNAYAVGRTADRRSAAPPGRTTASRGVV